MSFLIRDLQFATSFILRTFCRFQCPPSYLKKRTAKVHLFLILTTPLNFFLLFLFFICNSLKINLEMLNRKGDFFAVCCFWGMG